MYSDSLDKVLGTYLAAVTTHPYTYQLGKKVVEVTPMPLHVSPLLLRGFTCPPLCGGCCPRFTLDYLPTEEKPYEGLTQRFIKMTFGNGTSLLDVSIYTDFQMRNKHDDKWPIIPFGTFQEGLTLYPVNTQQNRDTKHFCNNLDFETGRCGIHGKQPFSCDFELIRFKKFQDHWSVNEQLFGRGWSFQTVIEGTRGAKCTITEADLENARDVARRITRLGEWADHFGLLNHRVPQILEYLSTFESTPEKAVQKILR